MAVSIVPLDARQLQDYKTIRLEALRTEPSVFSGDFEEELAQPDNFHWMRLQVGTVYGAYDNGTIVGMAGLIVFRERKLQHKAAIWGVYVSPAQRGQGIARQLLQTIIDSLADPVRQVNLAVQTDNKAAIHLYRSFGFEDYGLEKGAFCHDGAPQDEILMTRVR